LIGQYSRITMLGGLEYQETQGRKANEAGGKMTNDQLTLYWSTNRITGGDDDNIWTATPDDA
jgi:hypothetical protein